MIFEICSSGDACFLCTGVVGECMCGRVYLCMSMCVLCMSQHMYRLEDNFQEPSTCGFWGLNSPAPTLFFRHKISHWDLLSPTETSAWSHLPSTRVTRTCHHAQIFTQVLGVKCLSSNWCGE